jgi:hypothetical protein
MSSKSILIAGLLIIASFAQCSIASAGEVDDLNRELNEIVDGFNRDVVPEIIRQEEYHKQLQNSCYQGNTDACRESSAISRRKIEAMEQAEKLQELRDYYRERNRKKSY